MNPLRSLRLPAALLLTALLGLGCGGAADEADAYGTFEADEIVVSAEATGPLLFFTAEEGRTLRYGERVGLIDTTQLALRRAQLRAARRAARARLPGVAAQIGVLEEQQQVARTEYARLERLRAGGAATPQQMDEAEGRIAVLDRQIRQIRTQHGPLLAEVDALDAQLAQLDDQIRRSHVVNPVAGTVLAAYKDAHEWAAPGQPLYTLADLDTLTLRAYVSGAQLPHVRLGQRVEVQIDEDETANRALPGTVAWIASEAEFTPRPIQTKESRVDLVYAVRIRVPNPDGALKIGMPGEVRFVDRE